MIKKINKYLLENHPLVWNTRLVWMLGILVVMHLLFFTIGYFSYFSPVDLHSGNLFESYFNSGLVWIGVLLSILIFILWMNQYFKQNAFKLHYPKSNLSIYKEFLIIFLISLLGISQYFSYTKGLETRVTGLKSTEQLEKEIDLTNRAAAFTLQMPYYRNDGNSTYEHQNRCLGVPLFDSLVSRDEVLLLYVNNMIDAGVWQNVKIEDYKKHTDSLQGPLYTYNEYTSVLSRSFLEREYMKDTLTYKTNEVYDGENGAYTQYAVEETTYTNPKYYPPQPSVQSYNLNSIYNYCGFAVTPLDSTIQYDFYAKENYKLLNGNQKAKIQALLKDYLKLADEYEVGYRFKDKNWIDYVYNPPYYFIDYELTTPSRYNEVNQKTYKKDYIGQTDMETALTTIKRAKEGVFESFSYLLILYIASGISLLIFTFRMTTMRTWVVAVVGSIVVFFIYFCLYFLFGMMFSAVNETYGLSLLLGFIFLFFLLAFSGIFSGKRKLISGVNFIWSIWTFGAISPIIIGLYSSYLDRIYSYNYYSEVVPAGYKYTQHPHVIWIRDNFETIMYLNLILVFIFLILILPVIKKWKAMPEE